MLFYYVGFVILYYKERAALLKKIGRRSGINLPKMADKRTRFFEATRKDSRDKVKFTLTRETIRGAAPDS